jgi:hypothetical protein
MLTKLKKDLNAKANLSFQKKKVDLKINSKMDNELISDLISEKLMKKIKENVC